MKYRFIREYNDDIENNISHLYKVYDDDSFEFYQNDEFVAARHKFSWEFHITYNLKQTELPEEEVFLEVL